MKTTIALITIFMAQLSIAQLSPDNIVGNWLSAKKDSEIQIFKVSNKYFGKIVWGKGESSKDIKNPDAKLRNRDLIGLVILSSFQFDENEWNNGTIYDPREGKTYSCIITMNNKNELKIRGYVGVSLFGRTEVWTKSVTNNK